MSQSRGQGGPDGTDQPRVKRSRFDKPASSNGKAAASGPAVADGANAVTDRAAALERAKKALQLKDMQSSLQSKLAALKVRSEGLQDTALLLDPRHACQNTISCFC